MIFVQLKLKKGEITLDLTNKTIIMGILNLSTDSPIKESIVTPKEALIRATKLKNDGATIIDVGAQSSAANTKTLTPEEEIEIVIPVIKSLVEHGFLVSLDSWKPEVAEEAAKHGVHILNDINGLRNPRMIDVALEYDLPVCIMHMRGEPQHHYDVNQTYSNITQEIHDWFATQIEKLITAGIKKENIILDPGFEFGKPMEDNLQLLWELRRFLSFNLPLLVSASRKAFIALAIGLGRTQQGEGLFEATLTVQAIASFLGAHILRVHDVYNATHVVKFVNTLKSVATRKNLKPPWL